MKRSLWCAGPNAKHPKNTTIQPESNTSPQLIFVPDSSKNGVQGHEKKVWSFLFWSFLFLSFCGGEISNYINWKSRNFSIKLLLVTSVLALCRASTKLLAVCNSPSFGSSTATMLTIHWLHMAHFFGYVLPKNFGTPLPLVKGARRLLPPLPYSRCM